VFEFAAKSNNGLVSSNVPWFVCFKIVDISESCINVTHGVLVGLEYELSLSNLFLFTLKEARGQVFIRF